jgi:hypothetical protein
MPENDHTLLMPHGEVVALDHNYNSSLPVIREVLLDHTKLVSEVHKLHFRQRLGQHVSYLLICSDILELHCSTMYHISDVMVLDLDVLGLVMEHYALRQLHTTLVVTPDASHL